MTFTHYGHSKDDNDPEVMDYQFLDSDDLSFYDHMMEDQVEEEIPFFAERRLKEMLSNLKGFASQANQWVDDLSTKANRESFDLNTERKDEIIKRFRSRHGQFQVTNMIGICGAYQSCHSPDK